MAVRLAVTLGATTLLTIGAVGVGAATPSSDKPESTRETVGPKDPDEPSEGATTSTKVFPDEDSTALEDPAECLLDLKDAKDPEGLLAQANVVYQAELSAAGGYELVASAMPIRPEVPLEPPDSCSVPAGTWNPSEIVFCIDGLTPPGDVREANVERNGEKVSDGFVIDGRPVKQGQIRLCTQKELDDGNDGRSSSSGLGGSDGSGGADRDRSGTTGATDGGLDGGDEGGSSPKDVSDSSTDMSPSPG